MLRVVSFHRLLIGVAVASSLGIGYAIGAQPHMDATAMPINSRSNETTFDMTSSASERGVSGSRRT